MKRRRLFAFLAVGALLFVRLSARPAFLPLATRIDGPSPAQAARVIVFLHGRGGSLWRAERVARELRAEGLPANYAIVMMEGPYSTLFGHQWGDTSERQASARSRIRARLRELVGDLPADRVVIAGFSQGAGLAIDAAVEEPHIGRMASFSPCFSALRGELLARQNLRTFLAHGDVDGVCPVEESRSLARVLDGKAQYVEFHGAHEMPPEVMRAFVAFATAP